MLRSKIRHEAHLAVLGSVLFGAPRAPECEEREHGKEGGDDDEDDVARGETLAVIFRLSLSDEAERAWRERWRRRRWRRWQRRVCGGWRRQSDDGAQLLRYAGLKGRQACTTAGLIEKLLDLVSQVENKRIA